jgi:hypothetical protein
VCQHEVIVTVAVGKKDGEAVWKIFAAVVLVVAIVVEVGVNCVCMVVNTSVITRHN